jgi:acetolactate synthase I/II/III large subunit
MADVAEAYLSLLAARGIRWMFGNGGTDFAPIVEALVRMKARGAPFPEPITVPHEQVVASMAHGAAMVSGDPQLVMAHVTVGTANLLNGIINASRANAPILFTAGRSPITERGLRGSRDLHIHWSQESFDQGAMVREWVKWDYELRNGSQLETVVDRALALCSAEPRGPVYLTLPREVLASERPDGSFAPRPTAVGSGLDHPRPAGIAEAAAALRAARNPLIVTSGAGRDPRAVGALVALADLAAIPVVEPGRTFVNFPTTHPLHAGFDSNALVADADVILVVEADVPWIPARAEPRADATVIHLGVDPQHARYPIWGFRADVAITAAPAAGLRALAEELGDFAVRDRASLEDRRAIWTARHEANRSAWRGAANAGATASPVDFAWLAAAIGQILGDETICINEYDLLPQFLDFERPGSYFGYPPSGGLGWGLGAALGAKLAAPNKTVVCCVGDGSYLFGEPLTAHWVSRALGLPVLFVVFNNEAWNAVKVSTGMVYPEGLTLVSASPPFSDLRPQGRFDQVVAAFGGYGERVEHGGEVAPALQRAVRVVREEGRQALLNVACAR